jgi:hypothetical protein
VIAGEAVEKGHDFASGCAIDNFVDPRQREIVLGTGLIEAGEIDAHAPLAAFLLYHDHIGKPCRVGDWFCRNMKTVVLIIDVVQYIDSTLTLNGLAAQLWCRPTHTLTHSLTSPCSRNRGTTHDEIGVEAEGRSRRVEIPPQSQHRDGANVAAGVETGVCSKKTIAPRRRGSRS